MNFTEQKIKGVYLIEQKPFMDERGFFSRQFCKKELKEKGLDFNICQCNLSGNAKKGTLRGLHYQKNPYPEIKIVSCLQGSVYDVVVDFRPDSSTYLQHISIELSAKSGKMLYIPPLCIPLFFRIYSPHMCISRAKHKYLYHYIYQVHQLLILLSFFFS